MLFVLAGLLVLFVAGCAGSDGSDGAAGATGETGPAGPAGEDGEDLTSPQPILSGDFNLDILPLFTGNNVYFDGSLACTACHMSNTSESLHELNLNSRTGILRGSDYANDTDRVDLLGRTPGTGADECSDPTKTSDDGSAGGACAVTWDESEMRGRLRDTRMPPGWNFDLERANRDTVEINAVGAWVRDGAIETEVQGTAGTVEASDRIGYDTLLSDLGIVTAADVTDSGRTDISEGDVMLDGTTAITWQVGSVGTMTIGDLFTADGIFFVGSQGCSQCHADPAEHFSWHALDMGSYEGILWGVRDDNDDPATDLGGEDLLGRSEDCDLTQHSTSATDCTPNWEDSALRSRLRNTRMPPGWPFDLNTANRNMWAIESIGAWVEAGAPAGDF